MDDNTGACPRCGSTDGAPIAPGYRECRGVVAVPAPVPGLASGSRVCGHRYHTGTPERTAPMCRCGTYAIGVCGTCGTAVCGDHSAAGATRICTECTADRRASAAARRRAAHREQLAAVAAVPAVKERTLRAAQLRSRYTALGDEELVAEATRLYDGTPWNSAEWAAWFCARARAAGLRPTHTWRPVVHRQGLWKSRYEWGDPHPAWCLPGCSATRSTVSTFDRDHGPGSHTAHDDAYLLTDGKVRYTSGIDLIRSTDSRPEFDPRLKGTAVLDGATALIPAAKVQFARLLGIEAPPAPA